MTLLERPQSLRLPPLAPLARSRRHVLVVASLTKSLVNFRLELLRAMVAAGHRVSAAAPDDDPDAIATLRTIGVAFERIPMARAGVNPFADLRTLAALTRLMRRTRPDVLFAYTMKPIIYGGLAARLAGVPRRHAMFTGFGYMFSATDGGRKAAAVRQIGVQLYRRALVGCDAAFSYNETDAADIRRHRLIADDVPLVPVAGSGVDLAHFGATAPFPDTPTFLLVARLLRQKGIGEFAAAARMLKSRWPQARFLVLGPFDPSPLGVGADEMARWQADGAIEYCGETRDVRPFLARASVFVLPSYYREGIPRSALEALAAGRPVVTTDAPGCRETVRHGENGYLVPPRDVPALTEAMERFLLDAGLAERMGRRSRQIAETRFDVHAVNRSLLAAMGLGPEG